MRFTQLAILQLLGGFSPLGCLEPRRVEVVDVVEPMDDSNVDAGVTAVGLAGKKKIVVH